MSKALLPLLLCGGCLIVPTTRTTARSAGTVEGEMLEGPSRGLTLATTTQGAQISVHATVTRECRRQILAVTEITRTKHLKLGGAEDPRAQVFGLLLSPVTLPLSFLYSGAVVATDSGETERKTRLDHVVTSECIREAPAVDVELALPSGATVAGVTDAHGDVALQIPELEPYRGTATARAGGATTSIAYERPMPAVTYVRDAVRRCAAEHQVTGSLRVQLTVDAAGLPVRLELGAGDGAFAACVNTAVAKQRFPKAQRDATLVFPLELG